MNESIKCPKFEKKFEHQRTAKKFFCPPTCESQSGPEYQMERGISSHCDKNSSHNIRANTDEYPYCLYAYLKSNSKVEYLTDLNMKWLAYQKIINIYNL